MTIPRVFQTTSFRLTALYAILFVLSTGLLFGIVLWITKDVLDEQMREMVRIEMASLKTIYRGAPVSALASEITARVHDDRARPIYYGLRDQSGRRIAGTLPTSGTRVGWYQIVLPDMDLNDKLRAERDDVDDDDNVLIALGRKLDSGQVLTVAADTYQSQEAEEAIMRSFAWAAAVGLLLALSGGIALSRGFLRRVDEINRITHAIMRGDLLERIRTDNTGDELDQLGDNLNQMLDRLQALMDGLKQVSNDIAHDLRTPLSRLKQRLEAARLEAQTKTEYEQAIDEALEDANIALAIFGALLRIAQIESGSRRSNFSDVDLSALVSDLALTYGPVAEDLAKVLTTHIDPGQHVLGDRELLTQMFVNLIENALRHTQDGATIGLSVRKKNDVLIAEVFDNGPGISKIDRDKVFRRFYRLDNSRATPGNGLGLAVVEAIAALHGIQISLSDNNPGLKVTLQFKRDAAI